MKKIPTKNYIAAVIIMLVTIILTFTLSTLYIQRQNIREHNYMQFMSEVKPDEINNYIVENHEVMIYMTDSQFSDRKIDEKVEKLLTNSEYINNTIFLDMNNLDEEFYKNFCEKYATKRAFLKSNSLIIIKNEKIVKIINLDNNNIKNMRQYIDDFYGD